VSYLGGDYAIWLVVGVLYVVDAARLLARTEFLLIESGRRRFAPALSDVGFTLAGKVVAFAPLVRPHRAVFVVRWGDRWAEAGVLRATLNRLSEMAAGLFGLRVVVVWTSLWLFVGGPALTFWLGSSAAIYCTIAAVYPCVLVAALVLWRGRHRFRLSGLRIAKLTAEVLVCPPTLPNLLRKVTLAEPVTVDGVQLGLAGLEPEGRERFLERLDAHAHELINEIGSDEPEGRRLLAYLTTARAAR